MFRITIYVGEQRNILVAFLINHFNDSNYRNQGGALIRLTLTSQLKLLTTKHEKLAQLIIKENCF